MACQLSLECNRCICIKMLWTKIWGKQFAHTLFSCTLDQLRRKQPHIEHINFKSWKLLYLILTRSFFVVLQERIFLTVSNYIFTAIFVAEMTVKVRNYQIMNNVSDTFFLNPNCFFSLYDSPAKARWSCRPRCLQIFHVKYKLSFGIFAETSVILCWLTM